jgi:hypothetical protein
LQNRCKAHDAALLVATTLHLAVGITRLRYSSNTTHLQAASSRPQQT